MNFENHSSASTSHFLEEPGTEIRKQPVLRREEVEMYKSCTLSLYYKAGIPFAIFCQMLSSTFNQSKKVEITPKLFLRRGLIFIGNVVLGTLLFSPVCYNKLLAMREEFDKKNKNLEGQETLKFEGNQPVIQSEDFSYPTDVVSSLNEPESSFSLDFSPSKILSDDLENIKTPTTTYQDLRAQHRNNNPGKKVPSLNVESGPGLETYSVPAEKPVSSEFTPPRRIVKKNKYGDEIE